MRILALRAASALAVFSALAFPAFTQARQDPAPTSAAATGAVITVEFSNPVLSPSHWVLSFHPDGSGHFRSTTGTATTGTAGMGQAGTGTAGNSSSTGDWQDDLQVPDVSRDVQLSPQFAAASFQAARRQGWFNEPCESHLKVAFQGWKTLSYAGPDGKGSCTFNYSRDKEIESLGDSFIAVSDTILEGARLEMLLQHDPLGLEKEIEGLTAAARDGRAQQIGVIKGILQRLAQDENVMEMVRKRARLLLVKANS